MNVTYRININATAAGETPDPVLMVAMIQHRRKVFILFRIIHLKKSLLEMFDVTLMQQHILPTIITYVFWFERLNKLNSESFCKVHVGQQ